MDQKKLREWLHVRQLDDLLDVLPSGKLDEDGERPDFIVHHDGRALGIEVTEFHSDFREVARHSEQEAAVSEARAEHWRRFQLPLMVRVYWNSFDSVRQSERPGLVSALVETVARHTPPDGGGCVLDLAIDGSPALPPHIDRIDIYRYDVDPDIDWVSVRWSTVPDLNDAQIRDIVRRKSALVSGFRSVDELWLVICYGNRRVSSWARINETALCAEYSASFDRAFAVSYAPRRADELRVSRS
jgi:hypothetical protein